MSSKNEPKKLKKEAVKLVKACPVFVVNVCDESIAEAAEKEILSSFGSIDFIINNAGYGVFGLMESIPEKSRIDKYIINQSKRVVIDELMIHALNQEC